MFAPGESNMTCWYGCGNDTGTNSTNITIVSRMLNAPGRMLAEGGARMKHRLAKGAKGMGTLMRISSRRYAKWDAKRREANQSIVSVVAEKGAIAVAVVRRLTTWQLGSGRRLAGTDNSTNSTNRSYARCVEVVWTGLS
jgi:hypothetical protein